MPKDFGESIETFVERDGQVSRRILKCCHCGYRWEVIPGSGRVRGFCQGGPSCPGGVTCGRAVCERQHKREHLGDEARLEQIEGTRPLGKVLVPVGVDLT